eukprot:TRINITY_DN7992_c0_g1_i2.p1 TRINITY_DN7992_c0_g1~~TRINITY_DN7992_c0_g1_i2.p1  ORF type:complete len:178 (-),score=11.26 TRINITY_DN7992_c0_g1_i2:10-543(-)
MTIKFILFANKQGQVRLSKYFLHHELYPNQRITLESEIVRKCLSRKSNQCSFFNYEDYMIVYRRYASLFFVVGVDDNENVLSVRDFIHFMVETLDLYFESICELDIMYNLDKVHIILEELVLDGDIVETNRRVALYPIHSLDRFTLEGAESKTQVSSALKGALVGQVVPVWEKKSHV